MCILQKVGEWLLEVSSSCSGRFVADGYAVKNHLAIALVARKLPRSPVARRHHLVCKHSNFSQRSSETVKSAMYEERSLSKLPFLKCIDCSGKRELLL